jgi:HlyD family secretion protein
LVLQGNVDVRQANLAFKVGGRVHAMLVQEGDKVAAGQLIAELEQAEFEADLAEARGQVATQSAALDELVNGSRPEEIDQARAQVEDGEATLVNARLTFKRQQELLKTGNTPQSNVDATLATLQSAQARLASAKAALALAVEGPRAERIAAARGQLEQASAGQTLAEQHLGDTRLVAPEAGVILARVREPGTIVAAGDVVYTIVLTEPTWVRAYVTEPHLGRVRPGMKAEVLTDGGKTYGGQVGYVSPLAEFTPKTVQTPEQRAELVYRLRVVVDNTDDGLRQGMPVSVRLIEGPGR